MRKPFLDNLRYGIVLSVAVYHVFYQFNSVGVITNVLIPAFRRWTRRCTCCTHGSWRRFS